MAESLRDQLLKSGIVKQVQEEKRLQTPAPSRGPRPGGGGKGPANNANRRPPPPRGKPPQGGGKPVSSEEMDLAKAYALRARTEATERRHAEQEAAELARERKERKRKLQALLEGKALNKPDVEQVRHFPYGEKIRRVHVDAEQLVALNKGELGVVQHGGRYLLVDRTVLDQVMLLAPEHIALLVDPDAPSSSDDGVPDDLMW
jgi:uncharacterized protein YaiL (DUF2058 family)